jgi:hypothetical protein
MMGRFQARSEGDPALLVFIDESGDPGMKPGKSSRYFVVSAVVFTNDEAANECDRRITRLRQALKFPPQSEFHFNRNNRAARERFFNEVAIDDFIYFAFILNKSKLTGPGFQYKSSFYKYAVRMEILPIPVDGR